MAVAEEEEAVAEEEEDAAAGQEQVAAGREEAALVARSSAGSVREPPPASARGRPQEDRTATAAPQRVARAGQACGGWPAPARPSPPRCSPSRLAVIVARVGGVIQVRVRHEGLVEFSGSSSRSVETCVSIAPFWDLN